MGAVCVGRGGAVAQGVREIEWRRCRGGCGRRGRSGCGRRGRDGYDMGRSHGYGEACRGVCPLMSATPPPPAHLQLTRLSPLQIGVIFINYIVVF